MKQGAGFERFNLRHLRYFLAVCDAGSFRAASGKLNIAQSAVSRRVADLEQIFGLELFDRHARGIALSDAGRALRVSALRISQEVDTAHAALKRYLLGQEGLLKIGFFGTTSRLSFVPGLLARFRTEQPHIEIEILPFVHGQLDDATLASLDLAFHENMQAFAGHARRAQIYSGRYMLAMPREHRLAAREAILFDDLCNEELILFPQIANPIAYNGLTQEAARRGRALHIIHETESECSRLAFAAAGMGLTIVSPLAVHHDQGFELEYRPLADLPLDFDLWLSVRNNAPWGTEPFIAVATAFVGSLKSLR